MIDIPDNVDLQWIARLLIEFRDETRREFRALRDDLDTLTAIVLGLRAEVDALGARLLRVERRLDQIEGERQA